MGGDAKFEELKKSAVGVFESEPLVTCAQESGGDDEFFEKLIASMEATTSTLLLQDLVKSAGEETFALPPLTREGQTVSTKSLLDFICLCGLVEITFG